MRESEHSPFGHVARVGRHKGAQTSIGPSQSPSRSMETARPVGRASALGRGFRQPKPIGGRARELESARGRGRDRTGAMFPSHGRREPSQVKKSVAKYSTTKYCPSPLLQSLSLACDMV